MRSSASHPAREVLEAYVLDALDPAPARALEQHVRGCEACGARLAAEARREVALEALVPRIARHPAPAAPRGNRWLSPFVLAATGALGLLVIASDPRAIAPAELRPTLLGHGLCVGRPAAPEPLLCLAEMGGGVCAGPLRSAARDEPLFSCSDCSCRVERPQ